MESKNVRTHSVDRLCTKTAIYAQLLSENYKRQNFIQKFIKLEILNSFFKKKKSFGTKKCLYTKTNGTQKVKLFNFRPFFSAETTLPNVQILILIEKKICTKLSCNGGYAQMFYI